MHMERMNVLTYFSYLSFFIILLQAVPIHTVGFNPGTCKNEKRGNFTIIKDRTGNDRIVVCIKNENKFQWSMLNGQSYGNFIDPAVNCADVVDNIPGAQNGMYFIKSKKGPKQVYCDVTTDGGGFTLIGVKDTPISWAIPSSPSFIQPDGKSQWSSSLGDEPVLDFRIQISSSSKQKDTKAHWMYRLNSARSLSNILVRGEGGCSKLHPGIGNVAYVKDLNNNQIVSKNFQCSRFGSHIVNGLGWAKMNNCFKKACGEGFAHIGGFRYDSGGSFSYSVVSPKSGMRHNSTAFIGCDQGKCCACFGSGSDKDYCAPQCKAINSGTVLQEKDGMRAWFWIRSSLPKKLGRIWKKCVEYKKVGSGGKAEIWHVKDDGLYAKGPCSHSGEVRLANAVAVVSDGQRMNSLPNVHGLLSYQIDNGNLYLRSKSQWQKISNMKEIQSNKNEIRNNQNNMQTNKNSISYNKNRISSNNRRINEIAINLKRISSNLSTMKRGLKTIFIKSEGCDDPFRRGRCGHATIAVDGKDYSSKRRGYNVVVMNGDSGSVVSRRYFDTYASRTAANNLRWFLNSIGNRRIVLIAIQDEGAEKMTTSAYYAIRRFGARSQYKKLYRSSFAFIGWSGPGKSDIVTQVQRHRYKGPSIIHKSIFIPV